jgi:hypothetical protein
VTGICTAAALIIGVAIAVAAVFILILLRVQRIVLDRQRVVEDQLNTIAAAVRMIEAQLAGQPPSWISSLAPDAESEAAPGIGDTPAEETPGSALEPGIEPEIQAAIAAVAFAAVGPNAQVRSARMVKSPDTNAWSQQGRVLVQSSHNPRQ